jgi:hypothetical protein
VTANRRILLAGLALALAVDISAATAQDSNRGALDQADQTDQSVSNFKRDRNVSVVQRPHPGYEALGLREGAFMIWPKLSTTVEYNDNIFATGSNTKSDTIFHVSPGVDLTSNWSRHALDAYARATFNQFADFTGENTQDYSVGAQGRLDVLRTAQVNAGANWNQLTEPRTSAASLGQAHPVQYDLTSGFVSGAREFNRLRVSGRFDVQNFLYLSRTGNSSQSDRDRTLTILTGRVDYAVSPDTALFVQVAGNNRDYRLPPLSGVQGRDSSGAEVLAGANFELSALLRGEIGVGYLRQNYDNPAPAPVQRFDNISGLGARAQVEWFPTQLTTVTFTGSRTLEDAGIIGASGYLSTNVGAKVDHELLRNVILSAQASYGNDDYKGVDRQDKRYGGGVSATYLLNRSVGVTVGYNHFKQNSSGLAGSGDFTVNKVGATLTLQY